MAFDKVKQPEYWHSAKKLVQSSIIDRKVNISAISISERGFICFAGTGAAPEDNPGPELHCCAN